MRISHFAVLALLAGPAACRGGEAPARPSAGARQYTVRGEVVRVPEAAGARELSIRHEAIPGFADRNGAVVGMAAMVMPFSVAKGVSLAGVEVGDKVRFRFTVDWSTNRMEIDSVEELPKETQLDFGPPR